MDEKNNCLLCGKKLVYFETARPMECSVCHRTVESTACCEDGHFICDVCHAARGVDVTVETCLHTPSKNPITIMRTLMNQPCIHMHGPEHHVLVGAALLAAYHNCGGEVDLAQGLREMKRRGKQVPGGSCGFWGCCGAAVSAGIFVSIITGATPLKGQEWGLANRMTAQALDAIGKLGGPRCCKRDSFTAVLTAVPFVKEHFGVELELPPRVRCGYFPMNEECLRERCPYNPAHAEEN